jgi:hypothetical protein
MFFAMQLPSLKRRCPLWHRCFWIFAQSRINLCERDTETGSIPGIHEGISIYGDGMQVA